MFDHDPYAALQTLKPMAGFTLVSADFDDGAELPPPLCAAGPGAGDRSPQLSWSGFPPGTQSFALTCFDPDAPTGSGWWHWAVANLPATVTSLEPDAGEPGALKLPAGALVLPNEDGERRYAGSAPPPGTGVHRYMFVVHALDVPRLSIDPEATPANLAIQCFFHGVGRAVLTGTAVNPADA
ncbi:YbhB/YbcL family Raf kinase inhibitor-like protein [Agromyces lapidis]|uniref:YbhB/YbcL family Raf kinase inhibitor-like protein n=1 Tax=Agromyces lapidis TaxID=279574 RepID=A0ABV5STR1_9MICO|nr:YbhB/YbcL family Raf kinase inhibitor-like protein [Agromyces lapidis]